MTSRTVSEKLADIHDVWQRISVKTIASMSDEGMLCYREVRLHLSNLEVAMINFEQRYSEE